MDFAIVKPFIRKDHLRLDESIQKAIKALESEKNALETLRSDLMGGVVGMVGESVQSGLETPLSRLNVHSDNLRKVVGLKTAS